MQELTGKTAFITGGAQGIGLGIARAAAARGMKVAIVDIDDAALKEAESELAKVTAVWAGHLDVRDRQAYREVADAAEAAVGPVSLLCNNAGVSGQSTVTNMSYDAWDWVLGINLNGVYNGLQTFLPRMLERGGRTHIVNTASGAGLIGNPGFLYACSKNGVVGLSESLRLELAAHNVQVSVLCPSAVATGIIDHTAALASNDNEVVARGNEAYFETNSFFRPMLANGSHPDNVGIHVLDAVEKDQFFILTDGLLAPYVQQRAEEIIQAMPAEAV